MKVRPNRMIPANRQIYNLTFLSQPFIVALFLIEIKFGSFVFLSLAFAKLNCWIRLGHRLSCIILDPPVPWIFDRFESAISSFSF